MEVLKWKGLEIDPRKVNESTTTSLNVLKGNHKALQESAKGGASFLLPRIEAIHEGTTRNNTRYLADRLKGDPLNKSGIYSWTQPYQKPVIYNHDVETAPAGRVQSAFFSKETKAGRPGIIVVPKISEASAVQALLDGRLMTVSIGATTDSCTCSICGTDIIDEGWCGHDKGAVYDGHVCDWIIGQVWFDELSWVNVPADSDAMVTDVGEIQMSEAFAQTGEGIIDLGRSKKEWLVTTESAKEKGLLETNEKGDLNILTEEQIKLMQEELESVKNQNTQLTEALEKVTTEKSEVDNQLLEAKSALETKTSELAQKESELTEAVKAKEAAEAEVVTLTESVKGLESERESLLDQNTDLSSKMHKATAERVVDLKLVLGKVSNREEALEQHVGRTTESLSDSLVDLLVEATTNTPTVRVVTEAANPGVSVVGDGKESNVTTSTVATTEADKKKEPVTHEQVLKGLFSGATSKKK
jgi:hypothetical protein